MSLARLRGRKRQHLAGAIGVALFILALAWLDEVTRGTVNLPALVPPFGASVVIVFFTPESPFGRSWSVVGGHVFSALAAGLVLWLFPEWPRAWLAVLAVSGAGLLMLVTRSFHPPGGATALLAVVAERRMGFAMALCPMLIGAVTLVGVRGVTDRLIALLVSERHLTHVGRRTARPDGPARSEGAHAAAVPSKREGATVVALAPEPTALEAFPRDDARADDGARLASL